MSSGGGGGGFRFDSGRARNLPAQVAQTQLEASAATAGTEVANYLGECLKQFNGRDAAATRKNLAEIEDHLGQELEGRFDILFGGSIAKHTYVDGLSDVDALLAFKNTEDVDSPRKLLDKLTKRLADLLGDRADVSHGKLAVTVRYKDGVELQLIPAVRDENGMRVPQEPEQVGYGLLGRGEVCFLRADLTRAREYLDESYRVRDNLHTVGTLAETSLALAEVDLEEKSFEAAQLKARGALNEFEKERQWDQAAVANSIIAESLAGQHRLPQALLALNASVQLLANSEDKHAQMNARLHLCRVFQALGRKAEARQTLQSVLVDATKCRYLPQQLEARLFIAQLDAKPVNSEVELAQIRAEAAAKGLLLISRKASPQKGSVDRASLR